MKVLRVDCWSNVCCPHCKQDLFVMAAVPQDPATVMKLTIRPMTADTVLNERSYITKLHLSLQSEPELPVEMKVL
jgi:hypothetical protein